MSRFARQARRRQRHDPSWYLSAVDGTPLEPWELKEKARLRQMVLDEFGRDLDKGPIRLQIIEEDDDVVY